MGKLTTANQWLTDAVIRRNQSESDGVQEWTASAPGCIWWCFLCTTALWTSAACSLDASQRGASSCLRTNDGGLKMTAAPCCCLNLTGNHRNQRQNGTCLTLWAQHELNFSALKQPKDQFLPFLMTLHHLDAGFYGYLFVCLINQLVPSGLLWTGSLRVSYLLICQVWSNTCTAQRQARLGLFQSVGDQNQSVDFQL